jgi:hypothetical protein
VQHHPATATLLRASEEIFWVVPADEGTLPSLKVLEQCADAAFLGMLDSLDAHYGGGGECVRPVDGLSADFMVGLGIGQIATVRYCQRDSGS